MIRRLLAWLADRWDDAWPIDGESTNTPQGPQNGVQGRTGAFQREREGA